MNQNQKKKIRRDVSNKRLKHPKTQIKKQSQIITNTLQKHKIFQNAQKILLYIPIKNEVDTLELIHKNLRKKEIHLPRVKDEQKISIHKITSFEDLETGSYGIPEPKENCESIRISQLDLIIVPGVAFDVKGMRIGFGKGYYDRLLKNLKTKKLALAYEFQIKDSLPADPHDQKIDIIITEERTITI